MADLGTAYVQIVPSAKGIAGSLSKVISPEAQSAGNQAGGLLGTGLVTKMVGVIAAAGIGKKIMDVIGSSISEGAALEQSIGGIETLFGDSSDKVIKNARKAYHTAGMSANEYMEQTTSFAASLLQSTAGDTDKAADIANMAMIDMSDNANKMGTNMNSITDAYQGFAKQNYTMLDNLKLGYGGTKTEMERLLADAQKLTGVEYDLDNLGDVYEAIHAIQEELEITGTTLEEGTDTFSGSMAAMKAAYANTLGDLALGEDILPALNALAETTATFLFGNFFPMVGNILSGLPTLIGGFIQAAIPYVISGFGEMFSGLSTGMTLSIPQILASLNTMLTSMLNYITLNLPMWLQKGVEFVINLANGLLQGLPAFIAGLGQLIMTFTNFFITNLPTILQAGANLILGLVTGIITNLPTIAMTALSVMMSFISALVQNLPSIIITGINIITNLITGIIQQVPALIATVSSFMWDFISGIFGHLPEILNAGIMIMANLLNGINTIVESIVQAIRDLMTNIKNTITGTSLWSAGSAIMNSFLEGLKSAWASVKSFVGGIGTWIEENKGPLSYDRKMLIPQGAAIMESLNKGLQSNYSDVQNFVSGIAGMIEGTLGNNLAYSVNANVLPSRDDILGYDTNRLNRLMSIRANGSTVNSERSITSLINKTNELLERIYRKNPNLVTDDGAVLGHFTNKFDRENGILYRNMQERRL